MAYGHRFSYLVSVFILVSLLGFATAYVALAKNLIPSTMENVFGKGNLPNQLKNDEYGRFMSVTIFCFGIFLPLSIPR